MNLGEKIKTCRKSKNITQDKLAEYLNISFQAVSKWENNSAFPDIKLLPAIANFFDVSIDYLLENTKEEKAKEIGYCLSQYTPLFNEGRLEELVELLENTLQKYPNEYEIMLKLATTYNSITKSTHEHMMEEWGNKSVSLCERIIADSNDIKLMETATIIQFYSLLDLKEQKKAIEVANKRPSMYYSKDMLLNNVYKGNAFREYSQELVSKLLDLMTQNIHWMTFDHNGGDNYSIEEKIKLNQISIDLLETVLYDDHVSFFGVRLRRFYTQKALLEAKIVKKEEMYTSLEKAKELALNYDNRPSEEHYTSIVLNTQISRKEDIYRNNPMTDYDLFKNRLERKEFNPFREEPRFKKLLTM